MEPMLFGPSDKLFGVYFPATVTRRRVGIIVCQPFGLEFIRTYRSVSLLCKELAQEGFDVLKFDFEGCGDSKGDIAVDGDLLNFKNDVTLAINELLSAEDIEHVLLVGLRVGANVALDTALTDTRVTGVILWHPIVNGQSYMSDARTEYADWVERTFIKPYNVSSEEINGCIVSVKVRQQLESIDLCKSLVPYNKELFVITDSAQNHLLSQVARTQISDHRFWSKTSAEGAAFPRYDANAIVKWCCNKSSIAVHGSNY